MPSKSVTMKDVAKLAGVTQPTVSYVINNTANISPEVRDRVLKAIEETGYQPNALAQNLKRRSSHTIAILIPDIINPFYAMITKEIEQYFLSKGYFAFWACTNSDPHIEESYINTFLQYKVDGILIFSLINENLYNTIVNTKTPLVLLDDQANSFHLPYVHIMNQKGAYTAVKYLYDSGCQNIGFVSEPLVKFSMKERWKGFLQACEEFNLGSPDEHSICLTQSGDNYNAGYEIAERILEKKFDGIFVTSDYLACGIIKKLTCLNVNIPDEVSIIGYDGLYISKMITPTLSTMEQPISKICYEGANMLLDIIHSGEYRQVQELNATLVLRDTTRELPKK